MRTVILLVALCVALVTPSNARTQQSDSLTVAERVHILNWVLPFHLNEMPDSAKADFCRIYLALGRDSHAFEALMPRVRAMIVGREDQRCTPPPQVLQVKRWWQLDSIRKTGKTEVVVRATLHHPGGSHFETYRLRRQFGRGVPGLWYVEDVKLSGFVYN